MFLLKQASLFLLCLNKRPFRLYEHNLLVRKTLKQRPSRSGNIQLVHPRVMFSNSYSYITTAKAQKVGFTRTNKGRTMFAK